MLEAIRARSTSFVVKILFVLLIISFGAWGIGDILRGGAGKTVVASVGKVDIAPNAFNDAYMREMRRLQSMFGPQFDREQARAIGVTNAVLGRVVNEALLSQEADALGLIVSDEQVRRRIHENPEFFNSQRAFDPLMFEQVIRANGFDESQFVARTRRDIKQAQIVESVAETTAPSPLVTALFKHRMEERVATTFTVRDEAMTDIPAPEEDALQKYHAEHPRQFSAPEYRSVTAVMLDASKLAGEIAIADDAVRTAYQQREGEFRLPERRKLQHIVVDSEEKAKEALERLRKGEDLATVADEVAGMKPDALEIGEVSKEQLLPEMAGAAFAAPEGGYTEPVKSPIGWHIIKVASVSPAREPSFDEVRDRIRAELAHEQAIDSLFGLANQFEDALGGGATLEEAAGRLNLEVRKVPAVDRQGLDMEGNPVPGLPAGPTFLETVFAASEGIDTDLTEVGTDAYFLARVDKVIPSALRPFEQVRDDVIQAWTAERKREKAKQTAEDLVQQIAGGKSLQEAAASVGAEPKASEPFRRNDRNSALPQELIKAMFAAKPGQPATGRVNDGVMVGVLESVQPVDPASQPEAVKQFQGALAESLRGDLLSGYAQALRQEYPVSVNPKALESY